MSDVVVNGWRIYFHPCFLTQYEQLLKRVEAAKAKHPDTYQSKVCTKLLAAVRQIVFVEIPRDPGSPTFRLGNSLGSGNQHWFRAKFFQRYRLFFRFHTGLKVVVVAWMNDSGSLRAYESTTDAYRTFSAMLARGAPPDDWSALLAECSTEPPTSAPA